MVNKKQFIICTDGSLGDLLPMVRIAAALHGTGHRVSVIANERYQSLVEASGAAYLRWSSREALERSWNDPRLWHRRAGFAHYVKSWVSLVTPSLVNQLRTVCTPETTVVAQTMALGARIARELLPFRLVTVHLQPAFLRSRYEIPALPFVYRPLHCSPNGAALFYLLLDLFADRAFKPIGAIRRECGLPRLRRYLQSWIHSPDLSIALFPGWFCPKQPDWFPTIRQTGFTLPPTAQERLDETASEFLRRTGKPVLVVLGSAQMHAQRLTETVIATLRRNDIPVIVCAPIGEAVALNDPGLLFSRFIPFERILPHCRAFIHHGGIGSTAHGFMNGVPQLALPTAHDLFDNGARIASLGCGRSVPAHRVRPIDIVKFMEEVGRAAFTTKCRAVQSWMKPDAWLEETIRLITGFDP
jgi:rhamnosyltransferase subunit B